MKKLPIDYCKDFFTGLENEGPNPYADIEDPIPDYSKFILQEMTEEERAAHRAYIEKFIVE